MDEPGSRGVEVLPILLVDVEYPGVGVRGWADAVVGRRGAFPLAGDSDSRDLVVGEYFRVTLLAARDVRLPCQWGAQPVLGSDGSFEPGALRVAPVGIPVRGYGVIGVECKPDEADSELPGQA